MSPNRILLVLGLPVLVIAMAAEIATAYGQFVPSLPRGTRGRVIDLPLPCEKRVSIQAYSSFSHRGSTASGRHRPSAMIVRYSIYRDGRRVGTGRARSSSQLRPMRHWFPIGRWIPRIPSGRRCWAVVNFSNAQRVARVVESLAGPTSNARTTIYGSATYRTVGTVIIRLTWTVLSR